jgi:hypothetical protein
MLNRMNFALAIASNSMDGIRIDLGKLVGRDALRGGEPQAALTGLTTALLPGVDASALRAGIAADLETQPADARPGARAGRAVGLVLGSPEFQRR